MSQALTFFVPGIPVSQGSKRAFVLPGTRRAVMVEASAKLKPWRQRIGLVAAEHVAREAPATAMALRTGACAVEISFYFARPKSHFGKKGLLPSAPTLHAQKPDIDKLARACLDAMTGVVWNDDSQVFRLHLERSYCHEGFTEPGVVVTVERAQ